MIILILSNATMLMHRLIITTCCVYCDKYFYHNMLCRYAMIVVYNILYYGHKHSRRCRESHELAPLGNTASDANTVVRKYNQVASKLHKN